MENTNSNKIKSIPHTIYTKLFINGEYVEGIKNQTISIYNPATEQKICDVSEASEEDVDIAVIAAKEGFKAFSKIALDERVNLFNKLATKLEESIEELAYLECIDNGKPYVDAVEDIKEVIRVVRYYGGFSDKIFGETLTTCDSFTIQTRRVPYGVVGCIVPWNYPLLMAAWKIFPALCTGNSVILKVSEETPLTALRMAKMFQEVGFPNGLLNILPGYGHVVGAYISKHPEIRKIAFTGSTKVGREILKSSAESNLKGVHLELGGKSPIVIFADSDLEKAVAFTIDGAFRNSSQNCCCGSRVLIESSVYDLFVKMLKEKTEEIIVGHYYEENVFVGPLINKRQYDNVLKYIDQGKSENLDLLTGGIDLKSQFDNKGYFIKPTVYINVPDDSKLAKEEIFGPVLCVLKPFSSLEEALERANNTNYGLAAGVFTSNMKTAEYFVRNIEAGTVWVNNYNFTMYHVAFGGMKQSGFGRDNGKEVINEYTTTKSIYYHYDF
jgi:aldehyde dehydrogenase (NAD+)